MKLKTLIAVFCGTLSLIGFADQSESTNQIVSPWLLEGSARITLNLPTGYSFLDKGDMSQWNLVEYDFTISGRAGLKLRGEILQWDLSRARRAGFLAGEKVKLVGRIFGRISEIKEANGRDIAMVVRIPVDDDSCLVVELLAGAESVTRDVQSDIVNIFRQIKVVKKVKGHWEMSSHGDRHVSASEYTRKLRW